MLALLVHAYIEVGRPLSEAWNFPSPIKEAINLHQHHSYQLASNPIKGAAITCFARHLATWPVNSEEICKETVQALPGVQSRQRGLDSFMS